MTVRVWSALLVAAVGSVLSSCTVPGDGADGSGAGSATAPTRPSATPEGSWSLESGTMPAGAIVIPAKREITLEIAPPDAVGRSTCNSYGGRVRVTGGRIRFRMVNTTMMGCEKPSAAPERRYYGALPRVRAWRVHDGMLRLTGPGVELVFRPA